MAKRFLLVAACVTALLGAVAIADAATAKKHAVNDSLAVRVLSSDSTGVTYTGVVKDSARGVGAAVVRVTPGDGVFNLAATGFFKNGSLIAKGTNTATPRADGSGTDYAGTLTITGGTGVFKGAKGKLKLTGSSTSADPTYGTYKLTGTVTY
jgi:hypothetical protein